MFQFLNTWLSFDNGHRLLLGFDSPIDAGILLAVIIPWVRFTTWPLSTFLKTGGVIASLVCEVALLYLLAAITIAMFAASCLLTRAWLDRKALLIGFAAGVLVILAMLCIPLRKQALDVSLRGKQFIELRTVGISNSNGKIPLVLVDKNVLGHVYGQTLRLLLPDKPFNGKMLVALPNAGAFRTSPKDADTCVAFGASINSDACSMLPPLERLIVAHPTMPPPDSLPKAKQTIVMLPMIDEAGVNAPWEHFCKEQNIPCATTGGVGLDIQSRIGGFLEHVY